MALSGWQACLPRHLGEGVHSNQHTAALNQRALPALHCRATCSSALGLHTLPSPRPPALRAAPTAELEPLKDGAVEQTDEQDMGMSYEARFWWCTCTAVWFCCTAAAVRAKPCSRF